MQLFYEFEDKNGNKIALSTKMHKPEKMTNEPTKMLFYDVNNPKKYVFKDSLSIKIALKENGKFKSPSFFEVLLLLILPFITVLMIFAALFSL